MKAMEENSLIHRAYTKETLEQIKDQTTKTNGRVDKLSTRVDGLEDANIAKSYLSKGKNRVMLALGSFGALMVTCAASYFAGYSQQQPVKVEMNNYPQNGRLQKNYSADSAGRRRTERVTR